MTEAQSTGSLLPFSNVVSKVIDMHLIGTFSIYEPFSLMKSRTSQGKIRKEAKECCLRCHLLCHLRVNSGCPHCSPTVSWLLGGPGEVTPVTFSPYVLG